MKTSERPAWAEFIAYRLVMVELLQVPVAAQMMHLETGQVFEMLYHVDRFLLARAPGADDEVQRQKQLYLSRQLAAERVNHLQTLAVRGFNRSEKVKLNINKAAQAEGKKEFDRDVSPGDPRYLVAAARLAQIASKLPMPTLQTIALEGFMEEGAAEEHENPPEEACSAEADADEDFAAMETVVPATNADPEALSIDGVEPHLLAEMAHAGAVQRQSGGDADRSTKQGRREAFFRGEMG